MSGGFGICGCPESLIDSLSKHQEINNLTWIANDPGLVTIGPGKLISNG